MNKTFTLLLVSLLCSGYLLANNGAPDWSLKSYYSPTATYTDFTPGDILITEIMNNPNTIADSDGEWFEVYNTTGFPIDIMGWEISDDGNNSHIIASSVVINSGEYAVLGRNGDTGVNGGVTMDYVYGNDIRLGNGDDEIILTYLGSNTVIDRVDYDNGATFPDRSGRSMALNPDNFDEIENDNGFNWCQGETPYDANNLGTPGNENDICPCAITFIDVSNISGCNEEDNSFTADVTVTYIRVPAIGRLQLRRDARAGVNVDDLDGPNSHTFEGVVFPSSDGTPIDLRARFRDNINDVTLCRLRIDDLGTAPDPCLDNDVCEDAIPIGCDETIAGTNIDFSGSDAPSFCGTSVSSGAGVWFVFEGSGLVTEITTCGEATNFDTKVAVYSGDCGNLVCEGGDDDEFCEFFPTSSRVYIETEVGVNYYVYVAGFLGSSGIFELSVNCISPPTNDDACDAIPLTLGVQEVVNNVAATVQDGEPSPGESTNPCIGNDGWCPFETGVDNSVWYTIDIPEDGCYQIYTLFRNLQLALWSVEDCNDFSTFTEVFANDDFGPFGPDGPPFPFPFEPLNESDEVIRGGGFGGTSSPYLNEYLEAGTYYIQVDGFEGTLVADDFIVAEPSEECVLPCEEKDLKLTLTLDNFPEETTWELRDKDGNLFGEGGPYFFFGDGPVGGDEEPGPTITIEEYLCSEAECYDFSIFDAFGDGICCDDGEGSYNLSINDVIIYESDGEYGSGETVEICLDPCLLAGYETGDVGSAPTEGEYNCENEEVVITTTGQNGFDLSKDNFGYVYQELCGDGEIIAKVESVDNNGWAGIMFRETTDSDAKQFALYSQLSPITMSQTRYMTGGLKVVQQHFSGPLAIWLKIERQGDWFFAYKSVDGANFTYVHAVNVSMNSCLTVGMAAFTSAIGVPVTATFSNVQISGDIEPIGTPAESMTFGIQNEGKIKLFPNPANSLITIDLGKTFDRPTMMILRNQLGQVVEQRSLAIPAIRTDWNVSDLVSGLYNIEINTEGEEIQILRFIKE